jgi:hypothetical protein
MSLRNEVDDDPEQAAPSERNVLLLKNEEKEEERDSLYEESCDTIRLGIPIFLSMLSWVGVSEAIGECL